ncbi:hypothetical protein GSH19_00165 [Lactobacillus sp. S2-2]|uniref:hypothetical protein n=1 Tax=Lactobacillus sp. S2-2 TaxID=2692917 RepID=UPI001F22A698|nr:hypothetical protein [Lactobacillus sp. S2-2]MCF6514600.1 hypothetical protein [Lactobacillus sp. S2-2]
MKLHTLGPNTTDSYCAYLYWKDKSISDIKLVMHNSFEEIYNNLSNYKNDLFLVPTMYRDRYFDWATYHYQYLDQLNIYDTFVLDTKPMILIKNKQIKNQKIGLHRATEPFLNNFESETAINLKREFTNSKSIALEKFSNNELEYAIVTESNQIKQSDFEIIKRYEPKIIWCVYQII